LKLSKTTTNQFQFQLTHREKDLLLHVLGLYPRIPPGHQPLSRGAESEESNQRLLDDALAETRAQNQQELRTLLADPARLRKEGRGWCLTLSSGDFEWLLQVLNDVRVGSWILLGSPETPLEVLNAESAPNLWAMEMAGSFQMRFLELLND
jgi:hypothetical protein